MLTRRLVLLLTFGLAACGLPTPTPPAVTADQSIAATLDAAVRLTATALAINAAPPTPQPLPPTTTPEPAAPTDTTLPTLTPPPATESGPPEVIQISSPASGSAVISPVLISGVADGTFEQTIVVRITDEAGNILTTVPTTIVADIGQRGPYEVEVQFGVPNDQPGRIAVFSTSARDGGLIHLSSVEVTLLASGAVNLLSAGARSESIRIDSPTLLATVSGGTLHLTGFSDYVFESNLGVMLCGEGGSGDPHFICGTVDNILATGNVLIQSPDIGLPGPFAGDVTYAVAQSTRARLVVFSTSPRDGNVVHLASQEIVLEP